MDEHEPGERRDSEADNRYELFRAAELAELLSERPGDTGGYDRPEWESDDCSGGRKGVSDVSCRDTGTDEYTQPNDQETSKPRRSSIGLWPCRRGHMEATAVCAAIDDRLLGHLSWRDGRSVRSGRPLIVGQLDDHPTLM